MEDYILPVMNFFNLLALAYLSRRFTNARRLVAELLKALQQDLSSLDIDKPISDFPYRAEFLVALDLIIKHLDQRLPETFIHRKG